MHYYVRTLRLSALAAVLALGLALPAFVRQSAAAQSFANTAQIDFNGPGSGPALTYPSTIAVAGLKGSIIGLTVTLNGLNYNFPDNLDLLLVGPEGTQVMLMSDAGGIAQLNNVTLTFSESGATLPNDSAISSGTYRPGNYSPSDSFPAPAPAPAGGTTYATSLAAFNRTNPLGEWRLFALEDGTGTTGSIASWSLSIQTAELTAAVTDLPAAASVNAGSPLTYAVTVTNDGTEAVPTPSVSIAIPAGTSFSAATPPNGWSCPAPAADATAVSCSTASFAPGTVSFSVTVLPDKALAPGTTLTRSVRISSAVAEANVANNEASAATTVTTQADLAVTGVEAPAQINAGEALETVVNVQNSGPSNAANARVTLPVPARTVFRGLVSPEGWSCTTPAAGASGEAVCTRAVFTTESATFRLQVTSDSAIQPNDTINSSASIGSDTADPSAANGGTDSTVVQTRADIKVAVTDAPKPVAAASRLTYSIAVTNSGPSNAANTQLTTAVAVGTTFVSVEAPAGWSCGTTPAVGDIGALSCSNPSMGVGTDTIVLVVQVLSGVPEGAQLPHSSTVATSTADSDSTNNQSSVNTPVTVAADLAVTIEGVGPRVRPGSTLAYTVKVNNAGPEPAEAVTLALTTPANTALVSFTAPAGWDCTVPAAGSGGAISCTHGGMDVTTDSFTLVVQVADLRGRAELSLAASVAASSDKNSANNSVTLNSVVSFSLYLPIVRR